MGKASKSKKERLESKYKLANTQFKIINNNDFLNFLKLINLDDLQKNDFNTWQYCFERLLFIAKKSKDNFTFDKVVESPIITLLSYSYSNFLNIEFAKIDGNLKGNFICVKKSNELYTTLLPDVVQLFYKVFHNDAGFILSIPALLQIEYLYALKNSDEFVKFIFWLAHQNEYLEFIEKENCEVRISDPNNIIDNYRKFLNDFEMSEDLRKYFKSSGYEVLPHERRGHWRRLASGKITWVRETIVHKDKF